MEIKTVTPTVCGNDPLAVHPEVLQYIIEVANRMAPVCMPVKNGTVTILEYRLDQNGSLIVNIALEGIKLEEFDMNTNIKVTTEIQIK